jgi:hypothetical protein
MKREFDLYFLDYEQPTSCPKCGARTMFEELTEYQKTFQKHDCINHRCKYKFIGEFESQKQMIYS